MQRLFFIVLFGLVGTSILLRLGVWQVQRLGWKENMLAEIESRISAAPVAVPAAPDPEADRYLPVTEKGEVLAGEIDVFIPVQGGAAYRIVAPFRTEDGRVLMVDRGIVPAGAKNDIRPVGPMTVTGNLAWPNEADKFTPAPDTAGNIWYARDVPAMAQALGTEPILIVASSPTAAGIEPDPVDTDGIPNDHLNYAITWFSLAAIWVAMTAYFLWQTRARRTDKGKDR
ncbi:SURF1 family protein [Chachezhania sediminis]|uniref:SURF1 family protein n=1 Tax=Chachezhania sediminis TaxID=2599291 RepID=UPI00131DD77E|nr:SURF1 family protein [Chachezhania sediminis]